MNKVVLDIQNLSYKPTNTDKYVLSDINYQVNDCDFIIVLGTNGSGKSSLLKLIQRYPLSYQGQIKFNGQSILNYPISEYFRYVKLLTQNSHDSLFTSLSVFENYLVIKEHYEPNLLARPKTIEREFLRHYLSTFSDNLANKIDHRVSVLSGGEKQTLALAFIVLYPPRILLLDEHTSALDPKTAEQIMGITQDIVNKYQITCLFTTHDLDLAKTYGNRILALKHGAIYQSIESPKKDSIKQECLYQLCY